MKQRGKGGCSVRYQWSTCLGGWQGWRKGKGSLKVEREKNNEEESRKDEEMDKWWWKGRMV